MDELRQTADYQTLQAFLVAEAFMQRQHGDYKVAASLEIRA